jgi:hypothetical protein
VAAGPEREVEDLQHALLRLAVDVDEQVAAAHEVELREGRVAQHVVRREEHRLAQLLSDTVVPPLPDEEAAEALGREVGSDGVGVDAGARVLKRLLVDVRGEDLYGGR